MNEQENTHAMPMHSSKKAHVPAPVGLRFVNHMMDRIALFALVIIVSTIGHALMGHVRVLHRHPNMFAGLGMIFLIVVCLGYFVFFESLFQQTPGKWITGTKVVREDGTAPSFGQIVGRTFARLIPFEIFSFLGMNVAGWHDRFSGTLVVSDKLTAEDVRMIDAEQYRKVNVLATVIAALAALLLMLAFFAMAALSSCRPHRAEYRGGMMDRGYDSFYYKSDYDGYGYPYGQTAPMMMEDGTGVTGNMRWMNPDGTNGVMMQATPGDLQ